MHCSGNSCILFHNFQSIEEHRWCSLGAPESSLLCTQPIWEQLGASGRISVAVKRCWVVQWWLPKNFTCCWWGVPTVLEIQFMRLFMSHSRILLQGSVSTNLFDPKRHQVDLRKVEVGIQLIGNTNLVADIILPGVIFTPYPGRCARFSISLLVYISFLHEFCSHGIGFGLHAFAGSPSKKTSLKVCKQRKLSSM